MSASPPELSVVLQLVLKATPAYGKDPAGPNYIGSLVWGIGRKYAACSAPFARPAGSALNRLLKLGLVMRVGEFSRWTRTVRGDRIAAENNT